MIARIFFIGLLLFAVSGATDLSGPNGGASGVFPSGPHHLTGAAQGSGGGVVGSGLLLEDGVSFLLLEDNSSKLCLEGGC